MPQGKFFRIGYGIIIVFLIIFLGSKVDFLFRPLVIIVQTLLLPFIISGVLYYLLRPVVTFLENRGIKKAFSIPLLFLVMFGLIVFLVLLLGPIMRDQLNNFIKNIPQIAKLADEEANKLMQNKWLSSYFQSHPVDLSSKVTEYVNSIISNTGTAFNNILGFISSIIVLLSTVPFILYYLLKDGIKIKKFILRLMPDKHDEQAAQILAEMDGALSAYIQGKIVVSFLLGVLIYIGYMVIGIEYSLVLVIACALMNMIPFVGLFIGVIPSLVVAFIGPPGLLIKVIAVVVIAQQLEANLLGPQIMSKKLSIHPLTIILLLIIVGSMSGILGMFVAIPVYAVAKVIITHLYRIYTLRKKDDLTTHWKE